MLKPSIVFLSCLLGSVSASLVIPFQTKAANASDPFGFENSNGKALDSSDIYVATVKINGKNFEVQLDTGSSDLWLDTTGFDLSGMTKTPVTSTITYGDGTVASGPVFLGNVTFGEFSVQQAFISAPGSNATTNGDTGLLGVGPPTLSAISSDLNKTTFNGKTLMENIFAANPNEPNFMSFQLSRSETTGKTDGGTFTIGEIDSNFSGVSNSPKMSVLEKDRWVIFCDGIKVNGKSFSGQSGFNAPGQQSGQTLANLDTGTSLSLVPQAYADAIYGSIPGAFFSSSDGAYIVPCNAQIQLSFIFGGKEFPVHPIDTIVATKGSSGGIVCFGAFLLSPFADDSEDMLLGDSFLRNVYSVFNFGSFISGTTAPTIQLLSTTDATKAASEFNSLSQQRNATLGGKSSGSSGGSGSSSGSPAGFRPSTLFTLLSLGATAAFFSAL